MSKQVRETRIFLADTFPLAFFGFGHAKLPLKIGIQHNIFERCPNLSRIPVRRALWDYTKGLTYATAMMADEAFRVDLNGDYAGIVTDAESKPYRFAAWATHGNRLMYAELCSLDRVAEIRRQERDALAEQAVKDGNEIERLKRRVAVVEQVLFEELHETSAECLDAPNQMIVEEIGLRRTRVAS